MPAEGGLGTERFLGRIGSIIDFVIGVVYFRDTLPTVVKNLNRGTDKLVGAAAKPADEQDAAAWMDRNMTAACKACVRTEKRREAALRKEADMACGACRSKHGIHTCSARHGQHTTQGLSADLSGRGRKRQASRKLEPDMWTTSKSTALMARSRGSKVKETALREERHLRERTRRRLMEAVWKQCGDRPQEGRGLVGWAVESTHVDERDADKLCAGKIVSFARPDRYTVEWEDKSSTEYGYSDLFPRDDVPIVLPFGQLNKTHPMNATPSSRVGRHQVHPYAHTVRKGSKRAKSTDQPAGNTTGCERGSTDLMYGIESANIDTLDTTMEARVPAIRYTPSSAPAPGTVAVLPSRHDDYVSFVLAADTVDGQTAAAADRWPAGVLGPKPNSSSQDPCKFLRRGQLPATANSRTTVSETTGVQQQASNDLVAEYSKPAQSRKLWSETEFHMLQDMIAQGSKPQEIRAALNSTFHDGEDIRTHKSVSAAWRRYQRKRSTEASRHDQTQPGTTAQVDVDVAEGEEYVVEKILRKRWLGTTAEYEVVWQGYEATTWEPVSSLTLCVPAIEFERLEWNKQQSVRFFVHSM